MAGGLRGDQNAESIMISPRHRAESECICNKTDCIESLPKKDGLTIAVVPASIVPDEYAQDPT